MSAAACGWFDEDVEVGDDLAVWLSAWNARVAGGGDDEHLAR
jgi:hypothetical protein